MLIKEAIEMLKRMNPYDEVFLQFKEDVTTYRNNEHLRKPHLETPPAWPRYRVMAEGDDKDIRGT